MEGAADCFSRWERITKPGLAQLEDPRERGVELLILNNSLRATVLGNPERNQPVELRRVFIIQRWFGFVYLGFQRRLDHGSRRLDCSRQLDVRPLLRSNTPRSKTCLIGEKSTRLNSQM